MVPSNCLAKMGLRAHRREVTRGAARRHGNLKKSNREQGPKSVFDLEKTPENSKITLHHARVTYGDHSDGGEVEHDAAEKKLPKAVSNAKEASWFVRLRLCAPGVYGKASSAVDSEGEGAGLQTNGVRH